MTRIAAALLPLVALAEVAWAQPSGYASRLYTVEFQGAPLKATQFLENKSGALATCNALLDLADRLNPEQRTVTRSCRISLTAPDGSPPPALPSPEDYYVSYEDPAFSGQSLKTFTVYHLAPNQRAVSGLCGQITSRFHAHQTSVRCNVPKTR
jgi:hypothetical protein